RRVVRVESRPVTAATAPVERPATRPTTILVGIALLGAAISVALGVYGAKHSPTGQVLFTLAFSGTLNMKAWLATFVIVLAIAQVLLALWMYGKLGARSAPAWTGSVHRIVGML